MEVKANEERQGKMGIFTALCLQRDGRIVCLRVGVMSLCVCEKNPLLLSLLCDMQHSSFHKQHQL